MFLFLLVDTECSGRSLATLLVAWVGAAMIASILLRWKYMWIALAVLTLLFLLVCAYSAYNAKRAHGRTVALCARNDTTWLHSGESVAVVGTEIPTLSARITDCQTNSMTTREHPGYRSSWQLAEDLPPSYSSVIGETSNHAHSNILLSQAPTLASTKTILASQEAMSHLSGPPPYSTVVCEQTEYNNCSQASVNEHVESISRTVSLRTLPTTSCLPKEV